MSQVNGISGFDPLAERLEGGTAERSIFEDATRRIVENILKSYTGYYDLFAEVLQNALDAVEAKRRNAESSYKPKIYITIDIQNKLVRVIDNGCGMDLPQFKFCFSPSVSFKPRREYRGHKGVGATFLAYGFSLITLQTKQLGFRCAARLRQGRQWAEDLSGSVQRPVFEERPFDVPELDGESSGTAVEILIAEGQRPNLGYYGATTADQWVEMLRIRTPLGGVYLTKPPFTAQVFLRVIDSTGQRTEIDQENITYLFPHELPVINKVKDITEIDDIVNSVSGDPQTKMERLPNAFKRLDAIYEIWSKDMLLADGSQFSNTIDEGQRALIERHNIMVYGCFMSTAKTWTQYNDEHLHLRKGSNIIRGGLQLASDGMVQGDLRTIPLTSTVGY